MTATFSQVRQEESRIKVMMGTTSAPITESSALVTETKTTDSVASQTSQNPTGLVVRKNTHGPNNKKVCKFCHRSGHLVEECFRRPGYNKPPFKQNQFRHANQFWRPDSNFSRADSNSTWRNPRGNMASTQNDMSTQNGMTEEGSNQKLSQEQIAALFKLLNQQLNDENLPQIRATMASTSGNGKGCLWIVDSGATDHMTPNRYLFNEY